MTNLTWRIAQTITLTDARVPDPNAPAQNLTELRNVRVAFDNGFVHIDPRSTTQPDHDAGDSEYSVYVIPAAVVHVVHYRQPKPVERAAAPLPDMESPLSL